MRATRLPVLPRAATLLVLMPLVVAGFAPVHAGESAHVESSRHGDVVEIRASADLVADRDTAWRVLSDYGRYTGFIPRLRQSRVVSRDGTKVIVEQVGTAALGPLRIPIEITFEILESPPVGLASRALSGSLESLESRYTLSSREQGSRLVYTGRVRPGFPLLGSFGQAAVEANVAAQFHALVDEIERQHGGGPAPSTNQR